MKNKRWISLILIILLLLGSISIIHAEESNKDKVYVIPVNGEINAANKNFLLGTLEDLEKRSDVKAVIIEIDTYGGLIDQAIEMKDGIINTSIPTISYVNNKAESAGVLISIAGENLVMSENATIGSAETIPNTEKILSMWKAVLRDTAQYRDKDASIIESMADKKIQIEGITRRGQLTNLTSLEAIDLEIADFIAEDYKSILDEYGYKDAEIIVAEEGFQIKLAKWVSNPYINSLLLTIAFVGMVVEIFSPGFGLGGTISIIAFGLYFSGNILAGHSQWTSVIIFLTGLILLVVEVIIPGFGLPGISGIILVTVGLVSAMDSLGVALASMSTALVITAIITAIIIKLGFKSKVFDDVILKTDTEKRENYVANKVDKDLLDREGMTVSGLRPSGFMELDGEKIDVLSEEGFIEIDTLVKITRISGSTVFVRRV